MESQNRRRRVALHADDFGMNGTVTRGIIRGFTHGLLTSTSLLANAPACSPALAEWKRLLANQQSGALASAENRRRLQDSPLPFDLGVHLNLTQGRPLTGDRFPPDLLDSEGRFPGIGVVFRRLFRGTDRYQSAVAAEFEAQIEVVVENGCAPTHLNGHQYVEMLPAVAPLIPGLMSRYAIPVVRVARETRLAQTTLLSGFHVVNWCLSQVKKTFACRFQRQMAQTDGVFPDAFFGTSHAGQIDLAAMRQFLKGASAEGLTEIGMHPGAESEPASPDAAAQGWGDPLAELRARELDLLTSRELVRLLESQNASLGRLAELSRVHRRSAAA